MLKRIVIVLVTISFIFTSGPFGPAFSAAAQDHLRKPTVSQSNERADILNDFQPIKNVKDGGATAIEKGLIQSAITYLVSQRDMQYIDAVGAENTADLVVIEEGQSFVAGHDALNALTENNQAIHAVNVLCYNQIEGDMRAAVAKNAIVFLEVARSQLGYAIDETKLVAYVKEIMKKPGLENVKVVLHGDHIQYTQEAFEQKAILKEAYEAVHGKGTFSGDIKIDDIELSILKAVQKKLKANLAKERKDITAIIERLLKAGFTSIAVDASTIFDEFAGDLVADYYLNNGTLQEQWVVSWERSFLLPLEWGADFLKADPADKTLFNDISSQVVADMRALGRSEDEIATQLSEMEQAYGALTKLAAKENLMFDPQTFIAAYDKVMRDINAATVAGQLPEAVEEALTTKQRLMLIPGSNAEETAYQTKKIDEIISANKALGWLKGRAGKEIEIGHVDKKVPNPRRGGKLEAKMTHPMAVRVMAEYMKENDLAFDVIATNNGSGHGTDYDKNTLVPVSQVGKITPYLTREFFREIESVNAAVAQHGTSGSKMLELSYLAKQGVVKFNVATNYQQIILNVFSLLDDGIAPADLFEACAKDRVALTEGLVENARAKMMKFAQDYKEGKVTDKPESNDSEFIRFLKGTTAWGKKKGKIKDTSSKEDIALLYAKEFKRAFKDMDPALKEIGQHKVKRVGIFTAGGTASGHNDGIQSSYFASAERDIELVWIRNGWDGLVKPDLVKQARPLTYKDVRDIAGTGGTILGASRTNVFSDENKDTMPAQIIANMKALDLDAVIGMGGDDTLGALAKLSKLVPTMQFIGLSKTMDNDVNLPRGAWTYGFDSYVRNVADQVLNGYTDVKTNQRIYVAEVFGRNAGFVANRVGAMVGAARTFIPEEKEVDLEQFIKDLKAFQENDPDHAGVVIVAEGIKINRDYKNNAAILEKAFARDPAARIAFEGVPGKAIKTDSFGNPKLEKAGDIIAAILKSEGFSISGPEKPGYMARSGAASKIDREMTQKEGRAAVTALADGMSGKVVFVDRTGQIDYTPLEEKMGGRKLDLTGEHKDESILANLAMAGGVTLDLGTSEHNNLVYHGMAEDYQAPLTQRIAQIRQLLNEGKSIYNESVISKFRQLKTGEQMELSYEEMKALLWKLSTLRAETPENMLIFSDIARLVKRLPAYQQGQLRRLAQIGQFKNARVSILLAAAFEPTLVFGGAFNALIARAGALAGTLQDKYQPGVIVAGVKSLAGAKELETRGFVELNEHLVAVFGPFKIQGMYEGESFEVAGVKVGTLIVPEDPRINRKEQRILYFGPTVKMKQIGQVFKALGMEVEVVSDYGPGKEKGGEMQPSRFAEIMDAFGPKVNVIAASPVNKDGLLKMLKDRGYDPASAFKEALYAYNRSTITADTKVTDSLSCTTNGGVTWLAVLDDLFGIKTGKAHTVHAATDSNNFYPGVGGRARTKLDLLRGFSISDNIQPAGTNAADNLFKIKPGLKGKVKFTADRVGTLDGSEWSIDVTLENAPQSREELLAALEDFAVNYSGNVVMYWKGEKGKSEAPLEAARIVGNAHSSVIDSFLIEWDESNPYELKISGWYDNEGAAPAQMLYAWAQWMGESLKFRDALSQINTGIAPQAVMVDGGTAAMAPESAAITKPVGFTDLVNTALKADLSVYQAEAVNFDNIVKSASEILNAQGAVLIGANAILDNAGAISALQKAKDAAGVVTFAVWAKDEAARDTLEALGVNEMATIYIGLENALKAVAESKIPQSRTALISSDLDMDAIKAEFILPDATAFFDKVKVKNVYVATPRMGQVNKQINAMPLVMAKALAMIFNTEDAMKQQLQNMARAYLKDGLISEADMASLVQLTTQLADMPLVSVTDDVAKQQETYEDTLNKI